MAKTDDKKVTAEPKFRPSDLAESERFAADRDIITALFDKDKTYSITEAETIISDFKSTKVKE